MPTNAAPENRRLSNDQYCCGMLGRTVRVDGHDGLYVVHTTRWGAGDRLKLTVYPLGQPKPTPIIDFATEERRREYEADPFQILTSTELNRYRGDDCPPGTLRDIDEGRVTLAITRKDHSRDEAEDEARP